MWTNNLENTQGKIIKPRNFFKNVLKHLLYIIMYFQLYTISFLSEEFIGEMKSFYDV